MDTKRVAGTVIRCAGIVCAMYAMRQMLDGYSALRTAAEGAGLAVQDAPASLMPYLLLMAVGLVAGELSGRLHKAQADPE